MFLHQCFCTETKPTHRLSFNLNRKFNKVVNSPWKSNLEYEYVLRRFTTDNDDAGFDEMFLFSNLINCGLKLEMLVQLFVGIQQQFGLELRYFNFDYLGVFLNHLLCL